MTRNLYCCFLYMFTFFVVISISGSNMNWWQNISCCVKSVYVRCFSLIFFNPQKVWVVANGWNVMAALAKAQQLLLDPQEREYVLSQVNAAKGSHTNMSPPFSSSDLLSFSQLIFWHHFLGFFLMYVPFICGSWLRPLWNT